MGPAPVAAAGGMLLVIGCAVLALAVMATVLVVLLTRDDDPAPTADGGGEGLRFPGLPTATDESPSLGQPEPEEPEAEEPAFRDWLAPSTTIRVGTNRYVSPCQALGPEDVTDLYGDLPSSQTISEDSLDVSVADNSDLALPFSTRCAYTDLVTLEAEQHTTQRDLRSGGLGSPLQSLGSDPEYLRPKLSRFRQVAATSDDEALRLFVDDAVSAGQAYLKYLKSYNDGALKGLAFETVLMPAGYEAFSFRFFHDNVAYTLVDEDGGSIDDLASLTDDEVLERLERAKAAVALVREHVQDPQLSQSPAPTILGTTDKVGSTRLLEPCAILTRDIFRELTGRRENDLLRRYTLPPEVTPSSDGKGRLSPINDCERKNSEGDLASDDVSVRVQLEYAPNKRALNRGLRGQHFLPLGRRDTRLKTRADWAAEYRVQGFDDPYYKFIVGSYFVEVSVTNLQSDGQLGGEITQGQGNRELHVKAINALARSLRQHLARADASDGR